MHDRPTAAELVAAVRTFLETELLPTLSDARLRFQALVAANVLAIAGRELATEEPALRRELTVLGALLGRREAEPANLTELRAGARSANEQLCARVRAGDFDQPERFVELARRLREIVVAKLQVANPRYLK
jgi:hypothetical protein